MLTELRAMLAESTEVIMDDDATLMLNAVKSENDYIKDAFLDDPDAIVIGGENDPTIKSFIEKIPEDDEIDPVTNKAIDKIVESMIPETNIGGRFIIDNDDIKLESVSLLNEEIIEEKSAYFEGIDVDKKCVAFYNKLRAASVETDNKKANKLWRELKTDIKDVVKDFSKISNDNLADKILLLSIGKFGYVIKKDGMKRYYREFLEMREIYIDYMIKKTAGENVGYFTDYFNKAMRLQSRNQLKQFIEFKN